MTVILKRDWDTLDVSKLRLPRERHVLIPAGSYEFERIDNPYKPGTFFLVLEGTKTGVAEEFWRRFSGEEYGNDQVVILD